MNPRPPLPPFTEETARQKVQLAEDGWNSRDPERVALAYKENSEWRNRSEFVNGRPAIVELLRCKWTRELDYRPMILGLKPRRASAEVTLSRDFPAQLTQLLHDMKAYQLRSSIPTMGAPAQTVISPTREFLTAASLLLGVVTRMKMLGLIGLLAMGTAVAAVRGVAAEFDQTHALLTNVLTRHVKDARVDYAALKAEPTDLSRYLGQLAAVSRTEFKRWSEAEQISFLINAYNAFTLQLIIDHYPVKSIKDIGSLLRGPWDQPVVRLFGETITLNTLEHKILRVEYAEPRLHYAVICAAVGCPPLRGEAFVGQRLDEQLSDQARKFLATPAKNRIEAGEQTVYLSPLFKWYGGDFEKASGSVLAALSPYWPAGSVPVAAGEYKIKYTDYDWSLNEQKR